MKTANRFLAAAATAFLAASAARTDAGTSYDINSLTYPGATSTSAFGINDKGQIVGGYTDGSGNHAFLKEGDTYTSFDAPGAAPGSTTYFRGINNLGVMAGGYFENGVRTSYLIEGGVFNEFTIAGKHDIGLVGINDAGDVVGSYSDAVSTRIAFVESGGVVTELVAPGSTLTSANGINNLGQISGTYTLDNMHHGFIYSNGVYTTIDDPDAVDGTDVYGINDKGDVVGSYLDDNDNDRGFVMTNGVFTTIDLGPYLETHPIDINNAGLIVGMYQDRGNPSFLATPTAAVPEPSSLAMACAAIAFSACAARRRRSA